METSDPIISAFDNSTLLAGLPASAGLSLASDSGLTCNLSSLGMPTMAKDHVTHSDLSLGTQSALHEHLARISDVGAFSHSTEVPKSDLLAKQGLEDTPLNILSSTVYPDNTNSSPGLQFRSSGNGGDTMLSAINYTDSEMLADSAFDINSTPGLEDNLFGLGAGQGQGSNAFDLFDSGVNDPLSPFGDAGLPMDTSSLPTIEPDKAGKLNIMLLVSVIGLFLSGGFIPKGKCLV